MSIAGSLKKELSFREKCYFLLIYQFLKKLNIIKKDMIIEVP
jgi:hypothetical protein